MKNQIIVHSLFDSSAYKEDVELASQCPCCEVALAPNILYATIIEKDYEDLNRIFILNYCPSCENCFISVHTYDEENDNGYSFFASAPKHPKTVEWDPIIANISPAFVEIYNQSFAAEGIGLDQISGVGYRKALEFLVKDFLISQTTDPEAVKNIKEKFLGKCISENIGEPRLQTVASRAAWLGNDQTHYEQRFKDHDIKDLKRMINLTAHWICFIKETEEAESIQPIK